MVQLLLLLLRMFCIISGLDPGRWSPWDVSPHSTQDFAKLSLIT